MLAGLALASQPVPRETLAPSGGVEGDGKEGGFMGKGEERVNLWGEGPRILGQGRGGTPLRQMLTEGGEEWRGREAGMGDAGFGFDFSERIGG